MRETGKPWRHPLGVGSRTRRRHRPYDQEQAVAFRTHRPADHRCPFPYAAVPFHTASWGQDDPKRFPREPPGPPSSPVVAVMVNVSACTIEFTHSEFSFSVVVHPA